MASHLDWVATSVFIFFLALVTVVGFLAAHWKRGDLNLLEEWGLAGRRFGTLIMWFLLGGDLYTAYTMIAVPGLVYGTGAPGFFALPYTILLYPFIFVTMPRLWAVSRKHGYVTLSDFVRGRYGSHWLALAVALTGILATLPYIALQLVGMQVSIAALGFSGAGWVGDLPLVIAFIILAAYTYTSGLRAPASIALVKDAMIYIVVIAAVIWIPMKLGGYGNIFHLAEAQLSAHKASTILQPPQFMPFSTLALGSALALFLYPHAATAILSSSGGAVIKRNAALLPAYSLVLGLLALMGYMALAAGIKVTNSNDVVPVLLARMFPSWFAGFCFAAIAIGALVPAAIMSIAAANLFTRNIYREYLRPQLSPREESSMAKLISLVVKFGALVFVLGINNQYAINLQLLGGIWILQTFPAIIFGLFTRWFHPKALLAGWALGMGVGTWMGWTQKFKAVYPLHLGNFTLASYAAVDALFVNLGIAVFMTFALNAFGWRSSADETAAEDYEDKPVIQVAAV